MAERSLPLGIEPAQLVSLAARTAQILSGFITLLLVGFFFDLKTQGYFYTFNSLIALQVFAEMGLGMVLIQFSAHEMPRLHWHAGLVLGDPQARSRLRSLLVFACGWFGVASTLLIALLIPGGYWFFARATAHIDAAPAGVMSSWALLVLFVSANLIVTALCNIVEGTGKVSEIAIVRLAQAVGGAAGACTAIMLGAGLHALALQSLIQLAIGAIYLLGWRRGFLTDLLEERAASSLRWKSEILPFQWRIAISWLSGYFIFQLSTLLLFSARGPEAAGQMGMTIQIFSALSSICIIFVSARMAIFGRLAASQARLELDELFSRSLIQSFTALAAGLAVIVLGLALLGASMPSAMQRVLPLSQFFVLGVATLGSHAVYAQSIYLRAHKQEPFMALSLVSGLVMAGLASWLIPRFGTSGAVGAYALVTMVVSFPVGTWIFLRFRTDYRGLLPV